MTRTVPVYFFPVLCYIIFFSIPAISQDSDGEPRDQTRIEKSAEPEADSGKSKKKLVRAGKFMIVTANPHGTKAGFDILDKGGSAVDAMIASQLVLNLVEPQSSGIGGGAFLVHWDQKKKELLTYDGRETAPGSAKPEHFLGPDGKPVGIVKAVLEGLAVGVPGLVKLLENAHKEHGKLPWETLFQPAIELAEKGFPVSPRLHELLTKEKPEYFGPTARAYFFDENGKPRPEGYVLKNQAFADTLKKIAREGAAAFYTGAIAEESVKKVSEASKGRNGMTVQDLANYQVRKRPPVCTEYRKHNVCGMGLPSSGALTIGQVLRLIEPFDLSGGAEDHQALHYIGEAQKLAYADRSVYLADPDFVSAPDKLLDAGYLAKRRELIEKHKAMQKAEAGIPDPAARTIYGRDSTTELPGTSHISIIDADGNAVSHTTTIEAGFGSHIMTGGFLLNNELTDFSFIPEDDKGRPIANRVQGGKRPRSSMSPTIVFNKAGEVELVLGSPGGTRIILYVLKTLIAMIDWKMDQQSAVELANFGSRNGPFEMEAPGNSVTRLFLQSYGHKVSVKPMTSGLHVILKANDAMYSGVDPRREGEAMGK